MEHPEDIMGDYPTPNNLRKRLKYLSDPVLGDVYENMMDDYRWWGLPSQYSHYQSYFEQVRHREIHGMFQRKPVDEFLQFLDKPGAKDAWTVLPHMDENGNTFTAYPPGVTPPDLLSFKAPDQHPMSPHETTESWKKFNDEFLREYFDLLAIRDTEVLDEYKKVRTQVEELQRPFYRTGEAIVPDLSWMKLRDPIDPASLPSIKEGLYKLHIESPLSTADQAIADRLAPKPLDGDLSPLERSTSPVPESHWVNTREGITHHTRHWDQAAALGEQSALRLAYERALYTHHLTGIIAAEQNIPLPLPPLPDPRLSQQNIALARKRFASRLATVPQLPPSPTPSTQISATTSTTSNDGSSSIYSRKPISADPLEVQRYNSQLAAYIVTGQRSGLLPMDVSKLPLAFQNALEALKRSEFIISRADAIEKTLKGEKLNDQLVEEMLSTFDTPSRPLVHWDVSEAQRERLPRRLEPWERVPAPTPHQTSATLTASETASYTTPPNISGNNYSSSHVAMDWQSFTKDFYGGMSRSEFDAACEAMLQAVDINLRQVQKEVHDEAKLERERWLKIEKELQEFISLNPLPTVPNLHSTTAQPLTTRDNRYVSLMLEALQHRELHLRHLMQQYPSHIPAVAAAEAAQFPKQRSAAEPTVSFTEYLEVQQRGNNSTSEIMDGIKSSTSSEAKSSSTQQSTEPMSVEEKRNQLLKDVERSKTVGERLSVHSKEMNVKFRLEFAEFLERDVKGQLTMDEVKAFAERHQAMIGLEGAEGTIQEITDNFVETFRPLSAIPIEELQSRYGDWTVAFEGHFDVDHSIRMVRAQRILKDLDKYFAEHTPGFSLLNPVPEKTHAELAKESRERRTLQRETWFETLMNNPEDIPKMQASFTNAAQSVAHQLSTQDALRAMNAIRTDPELKYMAERGVWRHPEVLAIPTPLQNPATVLAVITRYLYTIPRNFLLIRGKRVWNFLTLQTRFWRRLEMKATGSDLVMPRFRVGDGRLDPKTAQQYHPYYLNYYWRMTNFFSPPSSLAGSTAQERLQATEHHAMTWTQWRTNEFRLFWSRRLQRMVSGYNFWIVPALALTAFSTYAFLEQRRTWAHELIHEYPEGLEQSAIRRRKFLQRVQLATPFFLPRSIGPTGLHNGTRTMPEMQNMAYWHRANSSNSRTFQLVE